ncbi:Eco57I restriction-modification methylase domain-containing protein [Dolichospermum sp. ST_con]|nr:Eco57I restriction-modification methylase domain-containing protein [Dolichospermum sp. ST_con]MDD1421419.1 Eco57I restriction-modification methylase domain-containing protein [Dolichospermum sp. ST_sed1]MDD1426931.1 Eco57I restriction-modification methylase domain-containing protein [Dolichospermum sp. ST_sed9]MDD1430027.1 Eco57I restriction-modification methylase domain-containing protein [Dolichospermum sp. ST_sed6]MDD1437087.1 Eco57I restriction-modification methylase domain-containing p
MTDTKNPNKPLFSQHYLQYRLQECLEWQLDINSDFEKLNKLYLSKKAILPTLNEAQTEDVFIKPVLEILGFKNIPQVVTRGKGRAERPDYALFANEEERDTAYTLQNNETAFYERVLVIAEAKYWERPLSKVSANDKRDIFKNENPSFQISSYLTGTNVDWGILTNGREWRLYYRQASSTATEFYPIDLVELLESADIEKFKYFWLFFRSAAFEKDNYNKNFLERVREGSTTYATQVGNELKKLVFEQIFPDLAGGFVADAMRRGKTVESKQVYAATLSFLYKLLFLLYAEARNLLPITAAYRDYSLIKITQEIAESIDKEKTWSQTSTKIYKSLLGLFEIVDRGDPALEVPRYNGGLFHFDFHEVGDEKDYPDNYFLSQYQLSDAVLVSALDKLARFEQLPIDYSFLGVRQLGSIYEGLLEYRVVIEDESSGKAHLENDKGERKATGSYYTPDYIVKYIVSHTLKPILEERKQRFADLMTQITQLHEKFQDGRLGIQSRNGLQKDLQRLERKAQNTLLDIKICDPAMGSGHFLVEAVDYFTDELITILNEYPEHNPVLEMLKQTRESILGNLQQQGITIDVNKLEDTQLLQRVVMKRCIYGVDLNPMAVELAKVSLWLHSFTIGAPLSFLDHHLRCGNSLIGTTAREAEAKMQQEKSGQLSLLTGPFVGLLLAAEIMRGVSTLSDATFAEVETSERLFKEFDKAAKPYKILLDIYVSKYFGVKQADRFLRVYGINAINANPEKMNTDDIAVYEDARKLFEEKRFFHWDLEFPEVFIDLENASWKENPGFDAVIGNPPYGDILDKKSKDYLITVTGMKTGGRAEIYTNFIVLSTHITKSYGYQSFIIPNTCLDGFQFSGFRKIITNSTEIVNIVDFRNKNVFNDADVITMIIVLKKIVDTEQLYYLTKYDIWDEDNQTFFLQDMEILINSENPWRSFNAIISKIENANICVKLEPEIATCHDAGVDYKWKNVGWQNRGEKSSLSELLFYHGTIKNQQDYQLLKGENINRYSIEYHDNYLIHDFEKYKNSQSVVAVYLDLNIVPTKIISRQTSDSIQASVDYQQFITSKSIHTTIVKNANYSAWYIISILNSKLLTYIYRCQTGEKGRTFAQVKLYDLRPLPIRKISFTTSPENRQAYLENTINLYQQYQINHNSNILLTQIDHHLNQQPSEADVIHDFLAYLAEQMIELNKQKQTEIKGFLTWLERFIGADIDNLTNKSKIQNYLGDYYKQTQSDNHLTLDELIEILNKNKKKLKIDMTTRKEQETLEKEYQSSLNTLLPIKKQLKQCDWLIDEIVYRLYGLTEEEKAIIQG